MREQLIHSLELMTWGEWQQVLLFGCGLVLIPGTLATIWREWRTRWERASGAVVSIHIATPGIWHERYFTPLIEFRYSVQGRTFTSTTFWNRQPVCETRELAEKEIAPYSAGMPVTVYYEPDNHARAFVVTGLRGQSALLNVIATLSYFGLAVAMPDAGKAFQFVLAITFAILAAQFQWLTGAPREVKEPSD